MVMLMKWPINGERIAISTEVANLMEGEWSCLRRWPL